MKALIIFIIIGAALATNYHLRRSTQCTSSNQCSTTASCCRDEHGQAVVYMENPIFGGGGPGTQSGTCTDTLGNSGDVCDSSCGCKAGYECYRPMSGVCCPPHRCYNATWVQQQKHYWANCRPPTCFYPP